MRKSLLFWPLTALSAVALPGTTQVMRCCEHLTESQPSPPVVPVTSTAVVSRISGADSTVSAAIRTDAALSSGSDGSAEPEPRVPPAATENGDRDSEKTVLFLTIVGEQTFYKWGRSGDRPPRVDGLTAVDSPASAAGQAPAKPVDHQEGPVGELAASASDYGGEERPYGPAPQECPQTLPPGSDQSTADTLHRQFRCRYLSTCSTDGDVEQCTWFYQGRG